MCVHSMSEYTCRVEIAELILVRLLLACGSGVTGLLHAKYDETPDLSEIQPHTHTVVSTVQFMNLRF